MAKLPISRVVNVTLTRLDRFATIRGFSLPILLTSESVSGVLDASNRTKVYGSIEEVAEDWNAADEVYKALLFAFSQEPRPIQVKVGHIQPGVLGETPTLDIADELDALWEADSTWYWATATAEFRDLALLDDVMAWFDTKARVFGIDSNDVLTESTSDTTCVAARNKGLRERSVVFYHSDANAYPTLSLFSYCGTRNFDQPNSAYTAKFKALPGVSTLNKGSAVVQAVTGFVPTLGLDETQGHMANAYVDIGGIDMVVEGNTLNGTFIDEIHAGDWIIARTEEELLSRLSNNARIAMTNPGIQVLVDGVEFVLNRATQAGLIGDYIDPNTGVVSSGYVIKPQRVENIPASQRHARIAPVIQAYYRYAGAVHYTQVNLFQSY
jgi:hypothetical protein